jgi:hypothetical protein
MIWLKSDEREKNIMNVGGPSATQPSMPSVQSTRADKDGDRDNDRTEGADAKAAEAQKHPPTLPADANRGRSLNTSA